jgi:type IV secretion system protein VirD4
VRENRFRRAGFAAVRMAHRWPWKPGTAGTGVAALGAWLGWLGLTQSPWVVGAGLVVVAAVTGWWWVRHVAAPRTTRELVARRAALSERSGGTATRLDVAEVAGPVALRRMAPVLRPSLAGLSWWGRRRLDPRMVGVRVARSGWARLPGGTVWSTCEDATLRVGGPRTGKTLGLGCYGLDAPGALVTTSTRLDLAEMLHAAREARGPVWFFNPAGLGGVASTVHWRVLDGCEAFDTACRRADDLIPAGAGGNADAERWDAQARRILALLLHAAAVSGRSMGDVRRWAGGDRDARVEVDDALRSAGGRDRAGEWAGYCDTNDRTRTSIAATLAAAVSWVSDDGARALGDPRGDEALIDIRGLLEDGQTLHLIGHETSTRFAPLVAALVAEIAHQARVLASHSPSGRLDPPVTMLLDEAAIACPVPLDAWTADMGGRGVTIHVSVQSLAQLRQRWGDNGSGTILANVAVMIIHGGSPSASDLRDLSLLAGEHLTTLDEDDKRFVPVLPPAEIRSLPTGQALVLRRGLRPIVATIPTVLERRGWARVFLAQPVDERTCLTGERITTGELEAMLDVPADVQAPTVGGR